MSVQILANVLQRVVIFLENRGTPYALVGGLAVSFRTIERTTKDIDIAIAVENDSEAENLIREFQKIHFQPAMLLENKLHQRISTVRLLSEESKNIYVDILFATSGIEKEVCATAEKIEILANLSVKIASLSSLVAMKVLSSTNKKRKQDLIDLENLLSEASNQDILEAKNLVSLIELRKFNEGFNLSERLENLISEI